MRENPILLAQFTDIVVEESGAYTLRREIFIIPCFNGDRFLKG